MILSTHLAFNPTTNKVYIVNPPLKTVSVIDGLKNKVVANIRVGSIPVDVAVNSHMDLIYVTNESNTVHVINGSSNRIITNVKVISEMNKRLGIDPYKDLVYVSNEIEGKVSLIDTHTEKVVAKLDVGKSAIGIAVNPITKRVYVANHDSNTFSVIDYGTTKSFLNQNTENIGHWNLMTDIILVFC